MKQWLEFWSFHLHPVCSWSVSQLHKMLSIDWIQRKMLQIQIQFNAPIQMSTGVLCKWCTPFLPSYTWKKKEREQDRDRDTVRASGAINSEIQQLCVNLQYDVTTWLWAILCGLFYSPLRNMHMYSTAQCMMYIYFSYDENTLISSNRWFSFLHLIRYDTDWIYNIAHSIRLITLLFLLFIVFDLDNRWKFINSCCFCYCLFLQWQLKRFIFIFFLFVCFSLLTYRCGSTVW